MDMIQEQYQEFFKWNILVSNDKSLIVSILSLGTFVGALLGYPSSDYLGRR
jgi:hypothetical protein